MERVSSKLFQCPVCFKIPDGLIYQCRNGHTICEPCSRRVLLCAQCGAYLGRNKMRNPAMEAFIAGMEIGCKFREQGCNVRLQRKDLTAHLENACDFNPAQSLRLCKILGFSQCNFVSRRVQPSHIYRHFLNEHEASGSVVRHEHYSTSHGLVLRKSALRLSLEYMKRSRENRMICRGVAVSIEDSDFSLLICYYTNIRQGNYYSVICLTLGTQFPGRGITVEINVPAKDARWSWSGKPIHFLEGEKVMANPPFQIPIPYLLGVVGDEEELQCAISYF